MEEVLGLINEMSPFLLLGFLLAGLLHVFVPATFYNRYMSDVSFRSVLYAALFGIPLPLCSCGVLPTAMSLHREGASKGATVSFLIATPQTGVDSIFATYALIGLPFAIMRPVAALFTSLMGGCLANVVVKDDSASRGDAKGPQSEEPRPATLWGKVCAVFKYGYVDMMQSIGRWLILGLVVAGLITVFVPDSFFMQFSDKPLVGMLLVLLCAIPMYLCATGSIPIAVALMLKGLSPGTALVLLMAGPAANVASILVVKKVLGLKTLLVYLFSIITGAIIFGLGIDYLLPREWFVPTMMSDCAHCGMQEGTDWFNVACSALLMALLVNAFIAKYMRKTSQPCPSCQSCAATTTTASVPEEMPLENRYKIEGMRCIHCAKGVKRAIADIDGVEQVVVDLDNGTAVVKGRVSEAQVVAAVDSVGFKASRL